MVLVAAGGAIYGAEQACCDIYFNPPPYRERGRNWQSEGIPSTPPSPPHAVKGSGGGESYSIYTPISSLIGVMHIPLCQCLLVN
jgi:hypothetical protein